MLCNCFNSNKLERGLNRPSHTFILCRVTKNNFLFLKCDSIIEIAYNNSYCNILNLHVSSKHFVKVLRKFLKRKTSLMEICVNCFLLFSKQKN